MRNNQELIKMINKQLQCKLCGVTFGVENIYGNDMLVSHEQRSGRKKLITFFDVIRFGGDFQKDILTDWIFDKYSEAKDIEML